MKKSILYLTCSALLLAGCSTNTGTGTYVGAQLGTILGSAIGGISGGPRGSDIGTIVGMVGGAAVGASIGNAVDKAEAQDVHEHYTRVQSQKARQTSQYTADDDPSGFDDSNSGDDRLYDFETGDGNDYGEAAQPCDQSMMKSTVEVAATSLYNIPNVEIRNVSFIDDNQDGCLSRGEMAKVVFEIMNRGSQTLYNVTPSVTVANAGEHILISPSVMVESIAPGRGIRYTATVKGGKKLRDGNARFALTLLQDNKSISKVYELTITTRR